MVASLQLNIHSGKGIGFCTKREKKCIRFLNVTISAVKEHKVTLFPNLAAQRSQLLYSCRITFPSKAPKLYTCVLSKKEV